MRGKTNITLASGLVFLWSAVAFFVALSPVSECIYLRLIFRNLNIPVFYWLWVAAGLIFVYVNFCGYRPKEALKALIPVAIIFHLTAFMARLLTNDALYSMDKRYLLYIFFAIYAFSFLSVLWAAYPVFRAEADKALLRLPLLFAPVFCFFYSLYKGNLTGIIIFALCAAPILALLVFRRLFDKFDRLAQAVYRVLFFIKSNKRALVWIIFLTAFLARFAFSLAVITKTQADYIYASDDGEDYDGRAMAICQEPARATQVLSESSHAPVYVIFLSVIYKLFGRNFYIAAFFQSLLGGFVAVMIYWIAKNAFDEKTAIVSGFLIALSQPLIFMSSVLGTEALYIPFLVLAVFLFLGGALYDQKKIYVKMFFAGLLFALAAMTLGSIALFPIVAFIFLLAYRGEGLTFPVRIKAACLFFISFLALFFLIRTIVWPGVKLGEATYESLGIHPWYQESMHGYDIDPDNRRLIALGINPFTKPVESVKIAFTNPGEMLRIAVEVYPNKLRAFFLWPNFGSFDPIFLANPARLPNRLGPNLEFYTLIFFFIGLVLSFKKDRKAPIIFILFLIAYYAFLHGILFRVINVRYSCPIKPFLIIFLAYGLCRGLDYFGLSAFFQKFKRANHA